MVAAAAIAVAAAAVAVRCVGTMASGPLVGSTLTAAIGAAAVMPGGEVVAELEPDTESDEEEVGLTGNSALEVETSAAAAAAVVVVVVGTVIDFESIVTVGFFSSSDIFSCCVVDSGTVSLFSILARAVVVVGSLIEAAASRRIDDIVL